MQRLPVLVACALLSGCSAAASVESIDGSDTGVRDGTVDATPEASLDADAAETVADASDASDASDVPDAAREAGPVGCIDSVSAGAHAYSCDGLVYDVTVPSSCAVGGCGLVVDVHGYTMSARMEEANTAARTLGAKYGFVVVQPNANPPPPASSWNPAIDDAKIIAFVKLALDAFAIDRARVHAMGFSQGGMMTSRFLCRHADLFASVSPGAGTGCTFVGGDVPSREIAVLYVHGTRDAVVPFATGIAQRDALLSAWKMGGETVVASGPTHRWTRWTSPSGTVFEFLQHDLVASAPTLGGHCFPGSTDLLGGAPGQLYAFACAGTSPFVWGEVAMKFFVDHPR